MRFTDTSVKRLKAGATRYEVRESGSRGFGVRVLPSGIKSWFTTYRSRANRKLQRVTHGEVGVVSLEDAHIAHAELRKALAVGQDPAAEKRRQRGVQRAQTLDPGDTVADLAELYVRRELGGKRSGAELERVLRHDVLPVIGALPVALVTRRTLVGMLDRIVDSGRPALANKVLMVTRRMLNFAVERGDIENNPALGMRNPAPISRRDRVLSDGEIRAAWHGTEQPFHRFALRWLLATGCRRGELVGARWDEIQGNAWTVPAERVKSRKEHTVPLSAVMRELLDELPRVGPHLLPAVRGDGAMVAATLNGALSAVIKREGLAHFTLHDLRRTCRTYWSQMRVESDVAEALLGHAIGNAVQGTYDRYQRFPEKQAALEKWGERLRGIVDSTQGTVSSICMER